MIYFLKKNNSLIVILFFIYLFLFLIDLSFCDKISGFNLNVQENVSQNISNEGKEIYGPWVPSHIDLNLNAQSSASQNFPIEKKELCGPWKPCGPECPCGMNRNWFERYADCIIVVCAIITTVCFF